MIEAMFREVGHGIAMGNAVDVLKEKATYITDNFDRGYFKSTLS
ncbi:MAG: HAD family hydrolase [Faecalibacillus faecis]